MRDSLKNSLVRFVQASYYCKSVSNNTYLGIVLCFGGGVLIFTVFIHILQEVRESLEEAMKMGILPEDSEFPFAEFMICVGNYFTQSSKQSCNNRFFKVFC